MHRPTGTDAARLIALAAILGTTACGAEYDPLTRQGMWHPSHVNHDNLTLMVANPHDLVRGTGAASSDGQLAAAAVDRLRNDKVKKLPATDIANITSGANDSSGSGAP